MIARFSLLVFLLMLGYAALIWLVVGDPVLKPFLLGAPHRRTAPASSGRGVGFGSRGLCGGRRSAHSKDGPQLRTTACMGAVCWCRRRSPLRTFDYWVRSSRMGAARDLAVHRCNHGTAGFWTTGAGHKPLDVGSRPR